MKIRTSAQWCESLIKLGVRPRVAVSWSGLFAEHVQESTFSRGFDDLRNFVPQTIHESGHLERLVESLGYSAERLVKVWPRRFPALAAAKPFEYNPEALAEKVYGGRLGNVHPGDGWKYRGRGLIMCTGLDNYALIQRLTGEPFVDFPVLLERPEYALKASIAWWEHSVDDDVLDDPEKVRQEVNGGDIGLEETLSLTELATEVLRA